MLVGVVVEVHQTKRQNPNKHDLLLPCDMQIINDPRRKKQDEKVRKDSHRRRPCDEVCKVDTFLVRVCIRIPVRRNGDAVEDGDEEGRDRCYCVKHHDGPYCAADGDFLAGEAEEEEQNGGFDEGEDGVVQQFCLGCVSNAVQE